MGLRRLFLLAAIVGFSASVAMADGADNGLKLGGGGGSPPCFLAGNFSFQGFTTATGNIDTGETGSPESCNNNGTVDIRSWSFDILAANVLNPPINPTLDGLLAPFADIPLLSALDWTASCTTGTLNGAAVDICTATISGIISTLWSDCPTYLAAALCSAGASLSATQMETMFPGLFKAFSNNPCLDPYVYVFFGVIPGCDISVLSDSSITNGGGFGDDKPFDLAPSGATPSPLPEPSTIYLMLGGLAGLPFLRRKLFRS